MALRPGTGAGGGGAAGAGAGAAGGGSFMFPVAGGMRPPQGLMPMQQQGFPMVSVMQPNMQGMIGMNYSSQMSQGPIAMQIRKLQSQNVSDLFDILQLVSKT